MPQLPAVSVAATPGAESHVVRVSMGDRVRTFEVAAGRLKDRLVAVLIAEFGLTQPEAHGHADQQIASAQANADAQSLRAERAADYERMAAELGRTQAALAKATNDLVQAQADLGAVQTQLAEAEAEMDRMRTQAAELHAQVEQLTAPAAPPPAGAHETKHYSDGSSATGPGPLPDRSPEQQAMDATGSVAPPPSA